ncbi:DUF3667 domain-containing protein [Carboxylicivirga linearis]|uniref:DUF3667 domain-containing protein n=1 Tax=Carboxylicivirga linearis TaxID=1628157 RepID=A0ABS5JYA0_9BACT|nr:DUF3667 domain-containing protein [Carboxylicivirga linearis]MBS2099872.1 DUF3667 domain-containing protein [Carboxylicivirga linearis]
MNCKNCQTPINTEYKYCNECGAKIISQRITVKSLISGLLVSLGWDSQFFVTFRDLLLKPHLVFERYLSGTRKKYTNPFTFFAIGTALSVFVLSFYSNELVEISSKASSKSSEAIVYQQKDKANTDKADFIKKQQEFNKKIFVFMFKYYYYLSFLILPIYALIALMVYGKPEYYGEHLVINAYIQGMLFFFGLPLFFLTQLLRYDVYSVGSILLTGVFYLYAYKKYRKHSFGKTLLKLLKFIAILLGFVLLIAVVGVVVGIFLKVR